MQPSSFSVCVSLSVYARVLCMCTTQSQHDTCIALILVICEIEEDQTKSANGRIFVMASLRDWRSTKRSRLGGTLLHLVPRGLVSCLRAAFTV